MPKAKLEVGGTLQATRVAFEEHRAAILRLTLGFAALNGASTLLDVAGAAGLALSLGITLLLGAGYYGLISALICLPDRKETFGELWGSVQPVLARLVWVTLISAVLFIFGLAALIVPGLVLFTFLAVAIQCVVVEQARVLQAFERSFRLVRGNAWRVFGFLAVLGLLSLVLFALALVVSLPLGSGLVANAIANFLSNLLSTPVLAIGAAVLYNSLADLNRTSAPEDTEPFATH